MTTMDDALFSNYTFVKEVLISISWMGQFFFTILRLNRTKWKCYDVWIMDIWTVYAWMSLKI